MSAISGDVPRIQLRLVQGLRSGQRPESEVARELLTTADLVDITIFARWASDHTASNIIPVAICGLLAKFGLDSCVVNIISMKDSSNVMHSTHIISFLFQTNMNRGDVPSLGELPYVQLVNRDYTCDIIDLVTQVIKVNILGDTWWMKIVRLYQVARKGANLVRE